MASDDIARLFAPKPASGAQDVRYRQGVLETFDSVTLVNTVLVGGATLTNLPLLGVEATLLTAGSVVGILVIGSGGGAITMTIVGQWTTP